MMFTYVWRGHDLLKVALKVPYFRLAMLCTLASLALWFLDTDRRRSIDSVRTKSFHMVMGLAVVIVLSVPFGVWPFSSFHFVWREFPWTLSLLVLAAASVRHMGDAIWYAKVNLFSMVAYTIVVLRLPIKNGRWGGMIYYDANDFALLLVVTIPIAMFFLRKRAGIGSRLLAFAVIALASFTLIKTGSRGGFLGYVIAMGYILLRYQAVSASLRLGAVVFGVATMSLFASDFYVERMRTLLNPSEDYNVTDPSAGRMGIWKRGFGYMRQRPILGVGVKQFSFAEGNLSTIAKNRADAGVGFRWSAPHSTFVQIGAELGFTGLFFFLAAFFCSFRGLNAVKWSPLVRDGPRSDEAALAQAIMGSLIAFCVSGAFLSHGYSAIVYMLLGMAIGIEKLFLTPPVTQAAVRAPTSNRGTWRQRVGGAARPLPS